MIMNEEMKVKNVLILEDNKSTQELLKNIFSRLEIHSQISVADSAKDAYVLAVGGFYDLFVVDVASGHAAEQFTCQRGNNAVSIDVRGAGNLFHL